MASSLATMLSPTADLRRASGYQMPSSPEPSSPTAAMASPVQTPRSAEKAAKAKKKAQLKRALAGVLVPFTKGFARWDGDGSGAIDREEFGKAMRALNLPCADNDEICNLVFSDIDFDNSGALTLEECLRYALVELLSTSKERVLNLCKLWDADSSKTINQDEFRRIVEALGFLDVPREPIDALFRELDVHGDGELEYDVFTKTLSNNKGTPSAHEIAAASESSPARPESPGAKLWAKIQGNMKIKAPLTLSLPTRSSRPVVEKDTCQLTPRQSSANIYETRFPRRERKLLNSSSRPPSPSGSDTSTDELWDADGAELAAYRHSAAYLNSTVLQEAETAHTMLQREVQKNAEAERKAEYERSFLKWPGYLRYPTSNPAQHEQYLAVLEASRSLALEPQDHRYGL